MFIADQTIYDKSHGFLPNFTRKDANGKIWMHVQETHGALTAYTPYAIVPDEDGNKTFAIYDTGTYQVTTIFVGSGSGTWAFIGVPENPTPSGVETWLQIGGYCENIRLAASETNSAGAAIVWENAGINAAAIPFGGGNCPNQIGLFTANDSETSLTSCYLIPKISFGST